MQSFVYFASTKSLMFHWNETLCRYNLSHTLIPFELQGEVHSISKVFRSVSAADAIATSMGPWQLALLWWHCNHMYTCQPRAYTCIDTWAGVITVMTAAAQSSGQPQCWEFAQGWFGLPSVITPWLLAKKPGVPKPTQGAPTVTSVVIFVMV